MTPKRVVAGSVLIVVLYCAIQVLVFRNPLQASLVQALVLSLIVTPTLVIYFYVQNRSNKKPH